MHIFRPCQKCLYSLKKISIKLYEELQTQGSYCQRVWNYTPWTKEGRILSLLIYFEKAEDNKTDIRYWSKFLPSTSPTSLIDPEVKVMDLEIFHTWNVQILC